MDLSAGEKPRPVAQTILSVRFLPQVLSSSPSTNPHKRSRSPFLTLRTRFFSPPPRASAILASFDSPHAPSRHSRQLEDVQDPGRHPHVFRALPSPRFRSPSLRPDYRSPV